MGLLPASVRTRLTLWYTVALAVPLIAFAVASYLIFADTIRARTDAFVGDALTVFAREMGAERRAGPLPADAIRRTLEEVRFREVDVVVLDASGHVVGSNTGRTEGEEGGVAPTFDVGSFIASLGELGEGDTRSGTVHRDGEDYRVLVRPVTVGGTTLRVAGVHSLAEVVTMLDRIRRLFLVAVPLIILCAAAGGSFLARRSFRPVTSMAARAAEIGASTLHERLPVAADDELGSLARVLNDLLDRLGRSFEQQRRFMTDASHELRTPTAIVRTEADVTLSRAERSQEEYRASMGIVRDAASRLTRIVDDLFLIARADAGHLVMNRQALYFDDLVRDTARTVKPIGEAGGVAVELRELAEAPMSGDADLLGRLILNLLDNAIKHSPEGASVEVSLSTRASVCELSVVDVGRGIPSDAREHVFERFFRADAARSRAGGTLTSGAGLGLPIGRRIAEMHGGRLELVESRPGRTEFRASLPTGSDAPMRPAAHA